MRIALVVDPLSARVLGGQHAAGLARALSLRGHEVAILGAPFPAPEPGGPQADRSEVQQPALDRRRFERGRASGRRQLLAFAPEAIVAYDAMSPSACQAAQVARKLRAPLVLVEHGAGTHAARTLLRGLSRVGSTLWGPYVRRATTCVVALDPWSFAQARREGFELERVRVVPHGVDTTRYRPGLSSTLASRHRIQGRVVIAVGDLEHQSRHELVIDAFAHTVGRRADWSLVVAGDGSARVRLRAAADRAGVGARVHWIGELGAADEAAILSSSTLAVLASADPRAALVAKLMACGVPIVAEAGGRAEFLVGDQCGVIVARGGWTGGLSLAASAPELRRRWSLEARRIAETQLDWQCVAAEFEAAILEREARLAG